MKLSLWIRNWGINLTEDIKNTNLYGILLIPGRLGARTLVNGTKFIDKLSEMVMKSKYCLSVCTGSALLAKTGSESITKYISSNSNVPLDFVEACYYRYNQDLLCGKIKHRDIWKSFCDEIGQTLDYNILIDSFKNTKLDKDMITLVKELKQKFTIGMVTDNKVDRIETILEFNNLNKYFDVVSISARLHSGKEANYIFNDTLKKLNVLP